MLHSTIINNDICASAFTKRWQFIFDNIIVPNINWFEQFLQFLQKYNIIYSQWSVPLHLKAHNTRWNRKHSQMLDGFSCNWQKVNSHFFVITMQSWKTMSGSQVTGSTILASLVTGADPGGVGGANQGVWGRSPPEAGAFKKIHNLKFKALWKWKA